MDAPPPLPVRARPSRLPGTYTVGHERDADPRVGRAVLVVLGVVCLGLQAVELFFLPHASLGRLLATAGRVMVSWFCLIGLAAGLGASRWPLALLHGGLGLWLVVHGVIAAFVFHDPTQPGNFSPLPVVLAVLFLGAGGWFGLSADLSAYLDRERDGALTPGSRLATTAVLGVALGLPAAGLAFSPAMRFHRMEIVTGRPAERVPLPPQDDAGEHFARDLVQRSVQAKDFSVFTASMSPAIKARTKPEWTRQISADLAKRDTLLGFRVSDTVSNRSADDRRELTYCNVFAVYSDGEMCFHCSVSRDVGATDWQVDMVFIE